MDFKEKKRRHQEWVQAGKEFSDVMRKYSIDRLDDGLYTSIIMSKFPDALPQCECTDDGDRALGIEKRVSKGGNISCESVVVSVSYRAHETCDGTRWVGTRLFLYLRTTLSKRKRR